MARQCPFLTLRVWLGIQVGNFKAAHKLLEPSAHTMDLERTSRLALAASVAGRKWRRTVRECTTHQLLYDWLRNQAGLSVKDNKPNVKQVGPASAAVQDQLRDVQMGNAEEAPGTPSSAQVSAHCTALHVLFRAVLLTPYGCKSDEGH